MSPNGDICRMTMPARRLLPAVLFALAAVLLAAALLPVRYEAVARVLLPRQFDASGFAATAAACDVTAGAESGSRVLSLRHAAADPARAAAELNGFLLAHVPPGMLVIDEASVPFAFHGPGSRTRAASAAAAVFLVLLGFPLLALSTLEKSKAPEREVVRYALRFAQLGQKTLLVETGTTFRVVLSGDAAAALGPKLEILASLAGGALTVARTIERPAVAWGRREDHKAVVNS